MSRLIIKNLPPYVTPARLREHFSQKGSPAGTITDVSVSQKQDGTSRRFGFVGFKSELEAESAQKWFNRTFIDSTRISVDVSKVVFVFFPLIFNCSYMVQGTKNAPAPRPNKRRRLNPPAESIHNASAPQTQTKKEDKLQKFMEVMQPKKGPSWANEALIDPPAQQESRNGGEDRLQGELSDMEWMRQRISQQVDQDEKVFEQSDEEEPPVEPVRFLVSALFLAEKIFLL